MLVVSYTDGDQLIHHSNLTVPTARRSIANLRYLHTAHCHGNHDTLLEGIIIVTIF